MKKKTYTIDERILERILVLNETEVRLSGNFWQFIKGWVCISKGVSKKSSCIGFRCGDNKLSVTMQIIGESGIRKLMEMCAEILALSSYIDDPPKPKEKIRKTAKSISSDNDCKLCKKRGKAWNGDNPKCAFANGIFSNENWNCETANRLRNLTIDTKFYSNDQYCGVIDLDECGKFLILSWYKSRGRTEGAWVVDQSSISPITLKEAEELLSV